MPRNSATGSEALGYRAYGPEYLTKGQVEALVPDEPGRARRAFNDRQHGPALKHHAGEHCKGDDGLPCYICELFICSRCGAAEMEAEMLPCDEHIVDSWRRRKG